jgi:hypothetical protein
MLNAVGWRYFTLAQLSNGRAIILLCGHQAQTMNRYCAVRRIFKVES